MCSVGETEVIFKLESDEYFPNRREKFQKGISRLRKAKGCEGDIHMSMREWIEIMDMENKGRLLELLDAHQKATAPTPTTMIPQNKDPRQIVMLGMWFTQGRGITSFD